MNVPIGLINSNWGGTPAEVWTEPTAVNNDAELKAASEKQQPFDWWPYKPGNTFNAMIAPIRNYNIAGAIWYQGEGNTAAPTPMQNCLQAWFLPGANHGTKTSLLLCADCSIHLRQ